MVRRRITYICFSYSALKYYIGLVSNVHGIVYNTNIELIPKRLKKRQVYRKSLCNLVSKDRAGKIGSLARERYYFDGRTIRYSGGIPLFARPSIVGNDTYYLLGECRVWCCRTIGVASNAERKRWKELESGNRSSGREMVACRGVAILSSEGRPLPRVRLVAAIVRQRCFDKIK